MFFLEIVLKYILKGMENAHFYSELNGIVLFLMWWQTQTPKRFKKKEVVKYGDKDNFNMVKKHWEKSCNCPESVLLTD